MRSFEKAIMLTSLCLLVLSVTFAAGFAFRQSGLWLGSDLRTLVDQAKLYRHWGVWGRPGQFMRATVEADDPRARILQPGGFLPGYRALMLYDSDLGTYSVRLLDAQAQLVHTWRLDYDALFPDAGQPSGVNPHGMEVFRDGSIAANFMADAQGLVRIDACSLPVWRADGYFHHSIHHGDNGALWTWRMSGRTGGAPGIIRNQDHISLLDADTGTVVREIALLDLAPISEANADALAVPGQTDLSGNRGYPRGVSDDIFHANDVEPLTAAMADAFPQFEAGDLLLSLRNLNYVAVLDPDTLELKWGQHGPWIRQHDPDFTAAGRIEVYNNNTGRGRSSITSVDPLTGETEALFATGENPFYSGPQGKQQKLPNGNYLIVVPDEGRILELTPAGQLVFEYNNIVRGGVNGRVFNAQWLPSDFFDTLPSCAN